MVRRNLTKRVDGEGRWSEVGVPGRDTRGECVPGRKLKVTWKGRGQTGEACWEAFILI